MGTLSLSVENLMFLLKNEESQFKNLLFQGLTHKINMVKLLFKNFYTYLTCNMKEIAMKK